MFLHYYYIIKTLLGRVVRHVVICVLVYLIVSFFGYQLYYCFVVMCENFVETYFPDSLGFIIVCKNLRIFQLFWWETHYNFLEKLNKILFVNTGLYVYIQKFIEFLFRNNMIMGGLDKKSRTNEYVIKCQRDLEKKQRQRKRNKRKY